MIDKRSWKEFKDDGLLWWINTILHMFGWAIVLDVDGDEVKDAYPARVKFRGYDEESTTRGYRKVSKYLKENIDEIEKEANE